MDAIVPISKMRTLVEERTGANAANKFFKLNPYVADIPDTFSKDINGVKLLVMGTVDLGGSGCVCPEHVMLKAILSALTYRKNDVVIMDMEAGLEHLGRGGSDTTAVALAACLKADVCQIFTDVDGVYDRDPRIYPEARRFGRIGYDRMLAIVRPT